MQTSLVKKCGVLCKFDAKQACKVLCTLHLVDNCFVIYLASLFNCKFHCKWTLLKHAQIFQVRVAGLTDDWHDTCISVALWLFFILLSQMYLIIISKVYLMQMKRECWTLIVRRDFFRGLHNTVTLHFSILFCRNIAI